MTTEEITKLCNEYADNIKAFSEDYHSLSREISKLSDLISWLKATRLSLSVRHSINPLLWQLYWNTTISESKINKILNIPGTSSKSIEYMAGTNIIHFLCGECGDEIGDETVQSREDAEYKRREARKLCDSCYQRRIDAKNSLEALRKLPYDEYLKSDWWKSKRQEALQYASYRCQLCNASNRELHVHHRSYENLGQEPINDLIVLCNDCHCKFHAVKEKKDE